jgi:hypothetical protein
MPWSISLEESHCPSLEGKEEHEELSRISQCEINQIKLSISVIDQRNCESQIAWFALVKQVCHANGKWICDDSEPFSGPLNRDPKKMKTWKESLDDARDIHSIFESLFQSIILNFQFFIWRSTNLPDPIESAALCNFNDLRAPQKVLPRYYKQTNA